MPINVQNQSRAPNMKGFEVARGRRGREIPLGLGPSLGSSQGVLGPGQWGNGQVWGHLPFYQ